MKSKFIHIIVILLLLPLFSDAQAKCSDFFKYRRPEAPYEYNDQSSSAVCVTGQTYEFILPLTKGKDYRLKFYAAAVFNNRINFKIIDQSNHETVLDLPGESGSREEGSCVLADFWNDDTGKAKHPYFDFYPVTSTTLKIIIEVLPTPQGESSDPNVKKQIKMNRGCVTVVVLDKKADNTSF
ncbi:MAG: hypothetical protein K8R54_15140 [Bacteroidales bacterium]|nr:hypothetical protein [Bacteroidales bacterium]